MALGEIARDLQKANSSELLWLREMRQYVNQNTDEALSSQRRRLAEFDASPEALTMEGQRRRCKMAAELKRKERTRTLYLEALERAEASERHKKGGGERYITKARPKINEILEWIERHYQIDQTFQLKVGEEYEDEEGGEYVHLDTGNIQGSEEI